MPDNNLAMTGRLSVKNFERYQHYKDRTPPWIKLYNDLLDDYEFSVLPDASKAHLMLIWLLASRSQNQIPYDARWIANKIGATEPVDLDVLLKSGFLIEGVEDEKKVLDWGSRYIKKEVKDLVWKRDGGKCLACGSRANVEYDHIVPVSKGGTSDAENLQLLCSSCNRKKRVRSKSYAQAPQDAAQESDLRSLEREEEGEVEEKERADALSKKPKPKRKGSRLPDDWTLPDDWRQWALDQGLVPGYVKTTADKFRDYWCAKPGAGAVKLDWKATWRNWVRNDIGRNPRAASRSHQGTVDAGGFGAPIENR